jgi:DNA-binding PadR family transcriptional regulator
MPIHHAVLALLADGSSYGYQLKPRFEQTIGPQWGEFNIGHLYQVLDRLERDGLVSKRRVRQTDRPDRVVYRLTRLGREELDRWLETPFVRTAYRDELFLKLLGASELGTGHVQKVVQVQREAYLGELNALRELRKRHRDDPLVLLLIEAAILHTKADLRVVELTEAAAEGLAESARTRAAIEEPPAAADEGKAPVRNRKSAKLG